MVILCPKSPAPRTFPGTMTVSFSLVCLLKLERFTTLLCLAGLSRSSAILFHRLTDCSLPLFLSSAISICKIGFVGPVLFAILLIEFFRFLFCLLRCSCFGFVSYCISCYWDFNFKCGGRDSNTRTH